MYAMLYDIICFKMLLYNPGALLWEFLDAAYFRLSVMVMNNKYTYIHIYIYIAPTAASVTRGFLGVVWEFLDAVCCRLYIYIYIYMRS